MRTLRLILCLLLLVATGIPACPANDGRYAIRYEKQHYFYHKGDEMNVIDIDLEWPVLLNGDRADALQQHLTTWLFDTPAADFTQARDAFLRRFGEPVSGQLATIPDDRKYCYVNVTLRETGLVADRFISLQATCHCAPASASSQQAASKSELFTYDMVNNEILTTRQILKPALFNDAANFQMFAYALAQEALEELPDTVSVATWPLGVGADESFMYFDLGYPDPETGQNTLSRLPARQTESILTRKFLKQLKADVPVRETPPADHAWAETNGGPIYQTADTMPRYEADDTALQTFLSRNIRVPEEETAGGGNGRVVFSFVVEPDGTLSHLTILQPFRPAIDRKLIDAVRQLHRWTPGTKDGKPVRVRMRMPVTLRLHP